MDTLSYKTISANAATVNKKWYVVDAENKVLGRLASEIAMIIRGKRKADFTPHVDCGDNVIVLNANKIRLTGDKLNSKEYVRYTGYPGGQRFLSAKTALTTKTGFVVQNAVKGMLPKNKLGRKLFGNLYVYEGTAHPHEGQQPTELKF